MRGEPIVVTGMGVVSAIGTGLDRYWQGLVEGRDGVRPLERFATPGLADTWGAEVGEIGYAARAREKGWASDAGPAARLALVAADMAAEDARVTPGSHDPRRVAVVVGTTFGEAQLAERIYPQWRRGQAEEAGDVRRLPPGTLATRLARAGGFRGPALVMAASCASGNYAIAWGADLVRSGRVEAALVGGVDAMSLVAYVGFQRLRSLAPARCQPFDRHRQGVVLGEGAAFLWLERAASARARGRPIHGVVLGHGHGFDAYNMAVPHPDGAGGEQAIRAALGAANLDARAIDYINAHGTGTPSNDKAETILVKRVLGARAYTVPMSSTKSMLGHCMGAASALEAVATLLALARGVLPPTINYEVPDPDCDLDYVPNRARAADVRVALSQAFAMGGDASALLLGRADC